jgi:hypothetical protein
MAGLGLAMVHDRVGHSSAVRRNLNVVPKSGGESAVSYSYRHFLDEGEDELQAAVSIAQFFLILSFSTLQPKAAKGRTGRQKGVSHRSTTVICGQQRLLKNRG